MPTKLLNEEASFEEVNNLNKVMEKAEDEDVKQDDNSTSEESINQEENNEEDKNDIYSLELKQLQEKYDREKNIARFEREKRKNLQKEIEDLKNNDDTNVIYETRIAEIIEQQVEKLVGNTLNKYQEDRLNEYLDTITDSQSKRDLIIYHMENSIKKTGNIKRDLSNAVVLANDVEYRQKLANSTRSSETKKMLASQSLKGTGKQKEINNKPILSDEEKSLIKHLDNIIKKK